MMSTSSLVIYYSLAATLMLLTSSVVAVEAWDNEEWAAAANNNNNNNAYERPATTCNLNPNNIQRPPPEIAPAGTNNRTAYNQTRFDFPSQRAFRNQFKAVDFTFNTLAALKAATPGRGGVTRVVPLAELPAVRYEGGTFGLTELLPCGVSVPHLHPRATEFLHVISGEGLEVGFREEGPLGGRLVKNMLSAGMTTFFPRALVHYQINRSCANVSYVVFFTSEDFGVIYVTDALMDLPTDVISAAYDSLDKANIEQLRNIVPRVVPGRAAQEQCMQQCRQNNNNNNINQQKINDAYEKDDYQ